jgi:hypothetical protein
MREAQIWQVWARVERRLMQTRLTRLDQPGEADEVDRTWERPAPERGGQADEAQPASLCWYNLVIECASPRRLADFWLAALGWAEAYAHGDEIGIEATDDPDDRIPAMVF